LFDGSGGRFAVYFGEFHMGERKSLAGTHCCCELLLALAGFARLEQQEEQQGCCFL
jgi:hypothetical protein